METSPLFFWFPMEGGTEFVPSNFVPRCPGGGSQRFELLTSCQMLFVCFFFTVLSGKVTVCVL